MEQNLSWTAVSQGEGEGVFIRINIKINGAVSCTIFILLVVIRMIILLFRSNI